MGARPVTAYTTGGQVVRSWLENLLKESNGVPLLLIVGGKVLDASGLLTNIAHAVDASSVGPVNCRVAEAQ